MYISSSAEKGVLHPPNLKSSAGSHVYKPVYDNIYWFGHVFYGTLFILMKLSAMISSPKAEKKAE
jgi:hypothetical protein